MKKILLVVVVQGVALFVITGLLCYFIRGDFFFRALAPIFGLAAGAFRFLTAMVTKTLAPSLYEDGKKKEYLYKLAGLGILPPGFFIKVGNVNEGF